MRRLFGCCTIDNGQCKIISILINGTLPYLGGILFEVATNEPGFDRDEAPAHLGEALKLPTRYEQQRAQIERLLPPPGPQGDRHVERADQSAADAPAGKGLTDPEVFLTKRRLPMTDVIIIYTETESKGRYAATQPDVDGAAELTTSKVSPTLIIADHTAVPDSMRGLGIGRALVDRLIADARAKGQRIVPLCPFVRAHAQKHREDLADVIQW